MAKPRVLFVCTHNSARSQMAEGFLRALAGENFDVESAGTEKTSVNPLAIRAMAERHIDISGQTSKVVDGLMQSSWDVLITVCDDANERCPFVPGIRERVHWSFPDPSRASGTDEERLAVFRRVRDQVESRIREWITTRP
jgi:arsenate reductase (thioredoxin)